MAPRKSYKRGDIISRSTTRRAKATAEAKKNAPVDVNAKIRKAADSFFGPNFSKNVKKKVCIKNLNEHSKLDILYSDLIV